MAIMGFRSQGDGSFTCIGCRQVNLSIIDVAQHRCGKPVVVGDGVEDVIAGLIGALDEEGLLNQKLVGPQIGGPRK